MTKEVYMKTAQILAGAMLIVGTGLALNVAQSQQPGVERTDLLRHDLGVPGREVDLQNKEPGIYVDVVPGEPLFASSGKYEPDCPVDASSFQPAIPVLSPVPPSFTATLGHGAMPRPATSRPATGGGGRECVRWTIRKRKGGGKSGLADVGFRSPIYPSPSVSSRTKR
jgi:hypothetical protein